MNDQYLGSLFIVAAPSGGGKTSLVRKLVHELQDIEVSISHTTRPVRSGEQTGIDYFFIDEAEFQRMIADDDFVEHARVFNYHYGTSRSQIHQRLQAGIDVVLDIDWQGAQQIKRHFKDAVSVFIVPPSLEVLQKRLTSRKRDDDEVIGVRMQGAQSELSHFAEFDYLIVNDDFTTACYDLKTIVLAHRLCIRRQMQKQKKLLSFLLERK